MRDYVWKNADGLEIGFGRRDTKNLEAGAIEVKGQVRQVELEIYFDKDNTTASVKNAVLPVGAVVSAATLYVREAFAGGTSVTVGTIKTDGTGAVTDNLVKPAAAATASLTKGAVIEGAGNLVGATVADALNITYATTGTFTAGRATLLVEYIHPSAQ